MNRRGLSRSDQLYLDEMGEDAFTRQTACVCRDCGTDTFEIGEYYMLIDKVWHQANDGTHDGMLCIGCVETRLGRRLTRADFTDAPVNWDNGWRRSTRLHDRLNDLGAISASREPPVEEGWSRAAVCVSGGAHAGKEARAFSIGTTLVADSVSDPVIPQTGDIR